MNGRIQAWARPLKTAIDVVLPLTLAFGMLVAAVPKDKTPEGLQETRERLAGWMRPLSLAERWGMYAPDPQRSMAYLTLTAEYDDGSKRELPETERMERGWGTAWAWQKTREDIWRYHVGYKGVKRTNRNRSWYLRGICVREARHGEAPRRIHMYQVKRYFTPPEKVRAGAPGLGKPRKRKVETVWCRQKLVKEMIARDAERRGEGGD